MRKTDKTLKRKKVLLLRNVLLAVLIVLTGATSIQGYRAFFERKDSEPIATESPAPAETPIATESPAPTETPIATESPAPTETPIATESPEPAETPIATESPEPTETPEGIESPEPAETPEETKKPEQTETLGEAVGQGAVPDIMDSAAESSGPVANEEGLQE